MTLTNEQALTSLEHAIEYVRLSTNADNGNDQFDAAHILIEAHQAIGPCGQIPSWMFTHIRRNAAITLEHAIARLGYYGADGWPNCSDDVRDAVHIIQHTKWGIEAMDSPASNRFWDAQRREYNQTLTENGII
jgi:hypothetical protein